MNNTKSNSYAKQGDVISISIGKKVEERSLVKFTDAKELVSWFRNRDCPEGDIKSNEDYMRVVAKTFSEIAQMDIPWYSEEAFIGTLFKIGFCQVATLN